MSREKDLNCTSSSAVLEMTAVFRWFDAEPNLTVAILTGAGKRAFSTGADLKEWNAKVAKAAAEGKDTGGAGPGNVPGAEGLSNRRGEQG
jgi:enoyl-CoA hydratase/carnithine racemase